MPTFKFTGYVIPACRILITANMPRASYTITPINQTISVSTKIENSKITADCEIDVFKTENIGWYLNYASDIARAAVQLAGFSLAVPLDIVFDRIIDVTGKDSKILNSNKLNKLCKSFSLSENTTFNSALQCVMKEPNLFLAIAEVIPLLNDGTTNIAGCQRSIERLRNLLCPGEKEAEAWAKFRETMRISRNFVDVIFSKKITLYRHGYLELCSGPEKNLVLEHTWTIIDRFIAYRMGNSLPLSDKNFPEI